jgi:hypothetical protein
LCWVAGQCRLPEEAVDQPVGAVLHALQAGLDQGGELVDAAEAWLGVDQAQA